jgi:hypothetical protein
MGVVLAPLAIVWSCPLSVSEYAAAGKLVEVPDLTCPGCGVPLRPWSWYERRIREGGEKGAIWVRRGRCPPCAVTHALLPDFVDEQRLDAVEVIGRRWRWPPKVSAPGDRRSCWSCLSRRCEGSLRPESASKRLTGGRSGG